MPATSASPPSAAAQWWSTVGGVRSSATSAAPTPVAGAASVKVDPWPFSRAEVKLVCDGKRFPHTFTCEKEMRLELREAPEVPLTICLRPAQRPAASLAQPLEAGDAH